MTGPVPDGRYAQHSRPARREEAPVTRGEVHSMLATEIREALGEMHRMDDTRPIQLPRERDSEVFRRTWWTTTAKTLAGIALVCAVIAAFWGGCVGARAEMDRAVTLQVAPVREDVAQIQVDLRELLRRVPAPDQPQ